MITVEEHLAAALAAIVALPPRREPLAGCHGLRLAEDVVATLAVPPFDNSAMDGFAVRAADVAAAGGSSPVRLAVVGDIPAGSTELPEIAAASAARIMTGSPLPSGADAVVPVELTDQPPGETELPGTVEIRGAVVPGAHVRRAAEDITPGAVVLRAGTLLGAAQLSAAASVGHGELLVHPRPLVGVIATGDELAAPGTDPGPGRIPDSNSILLAGLVREAGGRPLVLGPVGDDPERLAQLVDGALPRLDLLVTAGGVSVGTRDVVKAAFGDRIGFTPVAMQPGKPQGFGVLGGRVPFFALPGNPVSVLVSFHVFVAPALRQLLGAAPRRTLDVAVAGAAWRCPPGRRQYIPVVVEDDDAGPPRVRPAAAGGSGSHLVGSLAGAQALAVVAADVDAVAPGDRVDLLRWG
ncbi:molybdopterin molybdotransferase MoeA [Georgenia sunbinii]|uniref:molybdopterin molybdotransferase MoeA n=1 Tax=Georgenia sunbinii TaxID=3117728 RepID=UPI002F261C6C